MNKCPYCRQSKAYGVRCENCGANVDPDTCIVDSNKSPEGPTQSQSVFATILFAFLVVGGLFTAIILICSGYDYYITHYRYKPNCDYVIPQGYELYRNVKGEYGILVSGCGNLYLTEYEFETQEWYGHIVDPTYFNDSCKAKEYLRQYVEKSNPQTEYGTPAIKPIQTKYFKVGKDSIADNGVNSEKYPYLTESRNINFYQSIYGDNSITIGFLIWYDGDIIDSGTRTVKGGSVEKEKEKLKIYASGIIKTYSNLNH